MKKLLLSLLAILLIFEEWLWEILTAIGQKLAEWLGLAKFEYWLSQTSPNTALIAITVPMLIVTPINLAALWLLANGLILQGILLEIVAKLLGTLMVARVFALTKPQLLTFHFFALIYNTITGWLRWAHEKVTQTPIYRLAKQFKAEVKAKVADWFKS
jgi:hypothetical protein